MSRHAEALATLRNAATLLEDVGCDDYVNPPTAEAMQEAAVELRELVQVLDL